ncbi:UNVERIFIED_CONTAM: O-fucosyltransferase 15 [Sesamum radiatum]|uniref:O-fucosyltransferase family protein n=1 Tax=Sesamum radiatum TaxID=300843 RepID=A0AAW2T1Y2_SESRA
MSLSGPSDVATLGRGNISSENDDDYQGKDLGSRVSGRNSISSTRVSSSSPRGSCTSSTLSQLSILSLSPAVSNGYLSGMVFEPKKTRKSKRKPWSRKRMVVGLAVLLGFLFLMNSWMLSRIQEAGGARGYIKVKFLKANSSTVFIREELQKLGRWRRPQKTRYARLLAKAAHAMAEGESKPEPKDLWVEPYISASSWTPCANARDWEPSEGKSGYIMVTANGGINQQRVAVCNAVAVARLLNATLVLPKFMYSSVWRDASQFGDIFQEDHFINYLKPDIPIVKELPKELQSLDLEAIGSMVSDVDVVKEAKPSFYLKYILPILHLNRVVHFVGLGTDWHLIRYHLSYRGCQNDTGLGHLDNYLVGPFAQSQKKGQKVRATKTSRYLALHLRFEIDMVAHSLCEFGGGEEEMRELEAYRKVHFPALVELKKTKKFPSPAVLRSEGLCPLTPEETVLMLAALGFNRRTHIYLAGAHIYGGNSRLASLTTLFPNMVTKESLLSSAEIEPFANFSSQLAALDFIVCTAADAFAMTDSGSQFSSLIAGYRIYYGGGKMPTIRPNKRRLADIF